MILDMLGIILVFFGGILVGVGEEQGKTKLDTNSVYGGLIVASFGLVCILA